MGCSGHIEFCAQEYQSDTSLRAARYAVDGDAASGWRIERDGSPYLELGPGYKLLRTECCGICSTDLDRHHLPFPLPQITGHEVVAHDAGGVRYVVEINASHATRGMPSDCPFCRQGLGIHCPERLVVGIHALPGGFGPWLLAPVEGAVPLPDSLPSERAVLVEPFAAALKAVTTLNLVSGDTVAVLGPRRLGMLIVAALAGHRRAHGLDFSILAISRHSRLLDLAARFGADRGQLATGDGSALPSGLAEVVIDSTGAPSGLALGARLARRELHVKSTHGQPAAGLENLTQLVVDELVLDRMPRSGAQGASALRRVAQQAGRYPLVVWLPATPPPDWLGAAAEVLRHDDSANALAEVERTVRDGELPRADVAVVDSARQTDAVIRPFTDSHRSVLRPGGEIWLHGFGTPAPRTGTLVNAVATRGLRITSSRCGNFRTAVAMLERDPELSTSIAGLVTHRFDADELERALAVARSPEAIKVVVTHRKPGS